ncbi:MAG: hypothetical protein HGA22_10985, partial [Clostridiales bacterium]|nr:hypothetical protein [Clostridiales bacterium]
MDVNLFEGQKVSGVRMEFLNPDDKPSGQLVWTGDKEYDLKQLELSPDGKYAAALFILKDDDEGAAGFIQILDTDTCCALHRIEFDSCTAIILCACKGLTTLFAGSRDGRIEMYDA